jgi:hypothetical protein
MGFIVDQFGTREERRQRRAREAEQRAAALDEIRARQAAAEALMVEAARRGYGPGELLALAPREHLLRLLDLQHDAATANMQAYLDERDRRAAEFARLSEATSALQRLGENELPELVQRRRDAQRYLRAKRQRGKGAAKAREARLQAKALEDQRDLKRVLDLRRRRPDMSQAAIARRLDLSRQRVGRLLARSR